MKQKKRFSGILCIPKYFCDTAKPCFIVFSGKTSEEIFDEFRELVTPSQNGFFDLMRGIVKTMHVSSEADLKWAKEKEARLLAKNEYEKQRDKDKREATKINFCIYGQNCSSFLSWQQISERATIPLFKRFIHLKNPDVKEIKKKTQNNATTSQFLERIKSNTLMRKIWDSILHLKNANATNTSEVLN